MQLYSDFCPIDDANEISQISEIVTSLAVMICKVCSEDVSAEIIINWSGIDLCKPCRNSYWRFFGKEKRNTNRCKCRKNSSSIRK